MVENKVFTDFLEMIDVQLGRDEDSLNLFEWTVEGRYETLLAHNKEYFKDRPDLLCIYNEKILYELESLMKYFINTNYIWSDYIFPVFC